MTHFKKISTLLLVSMFFVGCAKERPIKLDPDPSKNRINKNAFLGTDTTAIKAQNVKGEEQIRAMTKEESYRFNTRWLGKVTIVKTSTNGGFTFTGYQSNLKYGYFHFAENEIKFYSANTPFQPNLTNEPNLVNSWNVTHYDKRLKEVDGKVTNVEVEDKYIPWYLKRHFKVHWSKAEVKEASSFPGLYYRTRQCWNKVSSNIVEGSEEYTQDYITYTVAVAYQEKPNENCGSLRRWNKGENTYTIHYKYSYKKDVPSDYQPYRYMGESDPLHRKYGFFKTILEKRGGKFGSYENIHLMNRWHPNKTHVFYFAKEYPEKYKWIFNDPKIGIFHKTNMVFKNQGLNDYDPDTNRCGDQGICFEIRNNSGQKFGDLRYSFIKVITAHDPSSPLGYGPSDAHPLTGEIIAANTMIWDSSLTYYVHRIADELSRDPTRFQNSSIYNLMSRVLEEPPETWTQTANKLDPKTTTGKAYDYLLPWVTFSYPGWFNFTAKNSKADQEKMKEGQYFSYDRSLFNPKRLEQAIDFSKKFKPLTLNAEDKSRLGQNFLKSQDVFSQTNEHKQLKVDRMDYLQWASKNKPVGGFSTGADCSDMETCLKQALHGVEGHLHNHDAGQNIHPHDTVVDMMHQNIFDSVKMFQVGKTPQQIIDTVMYRVGIHEFGHNMALRHNFFGSGDRKNFREETPAVDRFGMPIMACLKDERGGIVLKDSANPAVGCQLSNEPKMTVQRSSSVMEYLSLVDELYVDFDFEAYDKAALVYAYSAGQKDLSKINNTRYLYCTDDHRVLNYLCSIWDHGSTPTEIFMSHLKTYEDSYHFLNNRYGRPYWDSGYYESLIFSRIWTMKKTLAMWLTAFSSTDIQRQLQKARSYLGVNGQDLTDYDINVIMKEIDDDLVQSVKLSIAFYNAVVNLDQADRDYESIFDNQTGALVQKGIIFDKIYSMMFLAGDDTFAYNPNSPMNYVSYLTYDNRPELRKVINKVMNNTITQRVDMKPWFIGFGRQLFAYNAYNTTNLTDRSLIDKIRLRCYKPNTLKATFGIDPENYQEEDRPAVKLDSTLIDAHKLGEITDPYFNKLEQNDRLAITRVNGNYYVASETRNPYSYNVIWNMIRQPYRFYESLAQAKDDVLNVYSLYVYLTDGHLNKSCK